MLGQLSMYVEGHVGPA